MIAAPGWNGPQLAGNWDVIWSYVGEHLRLTLASLALGVAITVPLAYLSHRRPSAYPPLLLLANVVYAIPSLTLFLLLLPTLGYTNDRSVVVAMALFTLVILLRNVVEGLRAVPADVVDAATGMGYGPARRLVAVDVPLALPSIVAGLRLASVSTVSLISVGGLVGRGGLGRMMLDGVNRDIGVELWASVIAVVTLALTADALILLAGRIASPWTRVGVGGR